MINHQVRLAARPVGLPKASDWQFTEEQIDAPGPGGLIVKVLMVSLDPAMRGWMNDVKSYVPPVGIGEVMRAGAVGEVIVSNHSDWPVGTYVNGLLGVQEYVRIDAGDVRRVALKRIDVGIAAPEKWLNALGMPGMTAYFGLLEVGLVHAGETVVVSAAAGAVGQTVGQIAKLKGCRVVGIAGGPAKCEWVVKELGLDACIDYKNQDIDAALKTHCPDGVDVYFDNVGGEILDTVLKHLRRQARVVICGSISQYNASGPVKGLMNVRSLLVNRARMEGMIVFDYADRYDEAIKAISGWMAAGRLVSREHIDEGLANFPSTFVKLFTGENFGKLILKVAS